MMASDAPIQKSYSARMTHPGGSYCYDDTSIAQHEIPD